MHAKKVNTEPKWWRMSDDSKTLRAFKSDLIHFSRLWCHIPERGFFYGGSVFYGNSLFDLLFIKGIFCWNFDLRLLFILQFFIKIISLFQTVFTKSSRPLLFHPVFPFKFFIIMREYLFSRGSVYLERYDSIRMNNRIINNWSLKKIYTFEILLFELIHL